MIRRATNNDIDAIMNLLSQVDSVHAHIRPDIFIEGKTKYFPDDLIPIIANDERPIFLYEDKNGKIVGHAFCIFEEIKNANNVFDCKTLYIDDICVDENARNTGVATALYKFVKAFAKENNFDKITLNVWEGNDNARKFYDKMGLRPVKTYMEEIL